MVYRITYCYSRLCGNKYCLARDSKSASLMESPWVFFAIGVGITIVIGLGITFLCLRKRTNQNPSEASLSKSNYNNRYDNEYSTNA